MEEVDDVLGGCIAGGPRRKGTTAEARGGAVEHANTRLVSGEHVGDAEARRIVTMEGKARALAEPVKRFRGKLAHLHRVGLTCRVGERNFDPFADLQNLIDDRKRPRLRSRPREGTMKRGGKSEAQLEPSCGIDGLTDGAQFGDRFIRASADICTVMVIRNGEDEFKLIKAGCQGVFSPARIGDERHQTQAGHASNSGDNSRCVGHLGHGLWAHKRANLDPLETGRDERVCEGDPLRNRHDGRQILQAIARPHFNDFDLIHRSLRLRRHRTFGPAPPVLKVTANPRTLEARNSPAWIVGRDMLGTDGQLHTRLFPPRPMPTNAPLLLIVTTFFWGGNVVAGKLAVGDVSPLLLTFLRWFISGTVLYAISRHEIAKQWAAVKPRLLYVIVMAVIGFTAFNSMYYTAAAYTSGINIAIIQGSTPVIVLIGAALLGAPLKLAQIAGILLTLVGVCFVASKGDIGNLLGLKFNVGDLLLLTASILYAGYTLALRRRPPMPALVFFFFLAFASAITSIPGVIWEYTSGHLIWPDFTGAIIVLYVGLFPSLLCQVFYIRALEIAGPARASAYYNLVPIFGTFLSIALLGERFYVSDAIALGLVVAGILLAEGLLFGRRKP